MKLVTLVENTSASPEYEKKHGLCFYIETERHNILFDLGPDDTLIKNAKKLKIDLSAIDTVVISHGHKDHGGALQRFLALNRNAVVYLHRKAFEPHYTKAAFLKLNVGLDASFKEHPQIVLTDDTLRIDEELFLFSDIQGRNALPTSNSALLMKTTTGFTPDDFTHEQSLILTENGKQYLFGGCAHRGIANIVAQAEAHAGPLEAVISGFHLFNPVTKKTENDQLIADVAQRLKAYGTRYYTCHCTGKEAFTQIQAVLGNRVDYLPAGSRLTL